MIIAVPNLTVKHKFYNANGDSFITTLVVKRGLDKCNYHHELYNNPTTRIFYGQKYIIHNTFY